MSIQEKLTNEFINDYKEYCNIYNKQKSFVFASSNRAGCFLSSKKLKQIKKDLGL